MEIYNDAEKVLNGLRKRPMELPSTFLYNKRGSEIFEEINLLQDYYVFNAEIQLFQQNAMDIAKSMTVKYRHRHDPLCIAFIGNTVGNLSRDDTVDFFKNVIRIVGPNCQLLVGMDMWKSPEILYPAYHDKQGLWERFAKNGMKNALSCIGYLPINGESVDSFCSFEVEINSVLGRVELYVAFPRGLNLPKYQLQIGPGEKVLMIFSTKFTNEVIERIANDARLQVYASWGDASYYTCQMLLPAQHELPQGTPSPSVEVTN
eukprot:Gb_20905 [translate_table: standard]